MSETSTKHKNAKWNDNKVLQMMEFLSHHASMAGDGGNFPASKYNEAASHLAQYRDSGSDIKTGDQVETKYKLVKLFNCWVTIRVLIFLQAQIAVPTYHQLQRSHLRLAVGQ